MPPIESVGGITRIITPTLTVDTNIYAALDIIGGKLTLTEAVRTEYGSGILQAITITDDDNEKAAFDILIFDSDLGGTTTDNGAWTMGAGDLASCLGRITVAATDYVTMVTGSAAVASIRNIGLPVRVNEASRKLYALIIATGTPTYTAATDLTVRFHILQD